MKKLIIPLGLIGVIFLFKKTADAAGTRDLWFSVQYLDWPIQEINVSELIEFYPGETVESLRTIYSSPGYVILKEYWQ